jgi:hypothetical protein
LIAGLFRQHSLISPRDEDCKRAGEEAYAKEASITPVASSTGTPAGGENEDNGTPTVKGKPGRKPKQRRVPGTRQGIGGRPRSPPPPPASAPPHALRKAVTRNDLVSINSVKAFVVKEEFIVMASGLMCQPCEPLDPPTAPSPEIPPQQRKSTRLQPSPTETPARLNVPNFLWTSRTSTCFDLKLHPLIHRNVVCDKCLSFFETVLGLDPGATPPKPREEYKTFKCDRPWLSKFAGPGATTGKQCRRRKIYELHGEILPEDREECIATGKVAAVVDNRVWICDRVGVDDRAGTGNCVGVDNGVGTDDPRALVRIMSCSDLFVFCLCVIK